MGSGREKSTWTKKSDCGWLAETDLELLERVIIIDSSSCTLEEIEETGG